MKFYEAGRTIRSIDDLIQGNMYAVCGIVGELHLVITPTNDCVFKFIGIAEGIELFISRTALMDRIHLGMVHAIKKEFKPRESTMAKMMSQIKK